MCAIPVVSGLGRSGTVSRANDWLAERQDPTSNAPEASPAFLSNSRRLILMTTLPSGEEIFEVSDVIPRRPEAGRRTWLEG